MGQLFTVKMVAKKIISRYDDKGNKIAEREELIPQVYHDLPHQTAISYKTRFPDAQVEIVAQAVEIGTHNDRVSAPSSARPKSGLRGKKPSTVIVDEYAEQTENDFTAAQTGDMSAAINAELTV